LTFQPLEGARSDLQQPLWPRGREAKTRFCPPNPS
jgi:hypothetical protein